MLNTTILRVSFLLKFELELQSSKGIGDNVLHEEDESQKFIR